MVLGFLSVSLFHEKFICIIGLWYCNVNCGNEGWRFNHLFTTYTRMKSSTMQEWRHGRVRLTKKKKKKTIWERFLLSYPLPLIIFDRLRVPNIRSPKMYWRFCWNHKSDTKIFKWPWRNQEIGLAVGNLLGALNQCED